MPLLDVTIADYAGNRDHATRDFLFVVSESVANACQETRHVTLMLDITDEAHPLPVATFQVPESSGWVLRPRRPLRPPRAAVVDGAALLPEADGSCRGSTRARG